MSGTGFRVSILILLDEDTRRRELGRRVGLIDESSVRPHLSIRFGSERPASLEALSRVVERLGGKFVAERGVSSDICFTDEGIMCPDPDKGSSLTTGDRAPSAPGFLL
jgi:hypothetical protein